MFTLTAKTIQSNGNPIFSNHLQDYTDFEELDKVLLDKIGQNWTYS